MSDQDMTSPIAVVGMGCRFPGDATSPEALWDLLSKGKSAHSTFPKDRVNISSYFHPSGNRQGSICFLGAHFLKQDVAAFDSSFFSIPADEAKAIDPQQRMLLEVSVEALDSAGIDRTALRKSETGVWIGSFVKDYEQIVLRDPDNSPIYGATGNGIAIMANRISYFLDVNGPSLTIDTGCSASLVCVHNACQSLRTGEIDVGLAGGAGLILTPNTMMPMTSLNFLSPDGKCFTFDKRANGYGRGEGIGIVVLKRLSDAIRDNDNIRAVIRGSRVNQDGRTPGITLPSSEAQIRNIRAVYKRAGLDMDKTSYVECHGTGTQAGDVRELKAISTAFCGDRAADQPMYVGSIKPNIGHLEGCAGIAGLIKGILTLERGVIPKHINFEAPGNPDIDFDGWKVKVALENTAWPAMAGGSTDTLRRASVNCFGFGGTNAHVIMDDAVHYLAERSLSAHHSTTIDHDDAVKDPSIPRDVWAPSMGDFESWYLRSCHYKTHVFVFSAQEQLALGQVLQRQASYLDKTDESGYFLQDLAYTLACRRTKMPWRYTVAASSVEELSGKLRAADASSFVRTPQDKTVEVAFVFGGQGAQWFAMGRELLAFDIFAQSLRDASEFMSEKLGSAFSVVAELMKDESVSSINSTHMSQAATTALQVALIDLLVDYYGVRPKSVVGHSSGEIAAAYAMGAISREMAWELAYQRGRCASRLEELAADVRPGRMLAVGLSAAAAQAYLDRVRSGYARVACVNSPVSVTLSGDGDAINELHDMFTVDKVFSRLLKVSVAYHSEHMQRCTVEYLHAIAHLQPRQPARRSVGHPHVKGDCVTASDLVPQASDYKLISREDASVMYSSVTGEVVHWGNLGPQYWVQNMAQTVHFSDAVTTMLRGRNGKAPDVIVELGPHATLQTSVQQILDAGPKKQKQPVYLSMLRRKQNAAITALSTVGELWSQGCDVSMAWVVMRNVERRRPRMLADLPTYPWNHQTLYWHESHLSRANRFQVHGRYDLIGRPTADSIPFEPRWRGFLRIHESPWISQHMVQKTVIYPASGMVAMAVEAARQLAPAGFAGIEVSDFRIERAMLVPDTEHGLEYAVNMTRIDASKDAGAEELSSYHFSIYSKPLDGAWVRHGKGVATVHTPASAMLQTMQDNKHGLEYGRIETLCDEDVIPRQLYETLDGVGMNYGPLFQNITALRKCSDMCTYSLRIPDTAKTMPANFEFPHIIHPATLDSLFQTAFGMGGDSMVPSHIGSIYVAASPKLSAQGTDLVGYLNASVHSTREAKLDFVLSDQSWADGKAAEMPLVVVRDMIFTALSAATHDSPDDFLPNHRNLCSQVMWQLHANVQVDAVSGATQFVPAGPSSGPIPDYSIEQIVGHVVLLIPDIVPAWLEQLCSELCKRLQCETRTLKDLVDGDIPAFCVSLLEAQADKHLLWDCTAEVFDSLRELVLATKGMFWVTRGSQVRVSNPKAGLIHAVARTIRSEYPDKQQITLDIEHDVSAATDHLSDPVSDGHLSQVIATLVARSFTNLSGNAIRETEYQLSKGQLMVPRLHLLESINERIEHGSTLDSTRLELTALMHRDSTLVISGQGGLGMHIAKMLAKYGAKHLVLISRSGASSPASISCVAMLLRLGVQVHIYKADICDKAQIQHVFDHVKTKMPPVKGLFQCAATIRDAVFANMTFDDWQTAIRPKTLGAMNLYELAPTDMDFIVFLSSSAGVIGSRGQANYAAGNAFQDALAAQISAERHQTRAVSIDLGPVLGAGMLAEDPRMLDMLKASGFFGVRLQDFERVVECAIVGDADLPAQVVMGVGTGGLMEQNRPADPYWTRTALFERLNLVDVRAGSGDGEGDGEGDASASFKTRLLQALDLDEAACVVRAGLMHVLGKSLNMSPDDVEDGKPPSAYGVDSLVAVGVRGWVFRECEVDVSVFEVLSDMTVAQLSDLIVERGGFGKQAE